MMRWYIRIGAGSLSGLKSHIVEFAYCKDLYGRKRKCPLAPDGRGLY